MRDGLRGLAGVAAVALLSAVTSSGLEAQDPPVPATDTLGYIQSLTVAQLVAELPGATVALGALVETANRRSLTLESEAVVRQLAAAAVTSERGRFDPGFRLGAGLASSGIPSAARSRTLTAGVGTELPWGTLVDMSWTGGRAVDFIDDPSQRYGSDLLFSVSQPLLDGFGVARAPLSASRAEREAADLQFERARQEIRAQIEFLYWNLAEAEAVEAVLQRSFELAQALLFRNRQLAERDLIAEVDVITAESGVELRRASLIDARRARGDASDALLFAVYGAAAAEQLAASGLPLKTETAPYSGVDNLAAGIESALATRPDLAARRAALEAARELTRRARNGLRPGLFVDGSWAGSARGGSRGGAFDGLGENPAWQLGLRMAVPLGNFLDRGAFQQASLSERLRSIALQASENVVRLEVRQARRGVEAGLERRNAADSAAELARAQLRAEQQRLELGLGDSFRLLQTEETAVQAALASVQAQFDLARAITDLRLARGETGG